MKQALEARSDVGESASSQDVTQEKQTLPDDNRLVQMALKAQADRKAGRAIRLP